MRASLSYVSRTGKFPGTVAGNLCANHAYGFPSVAGHEASCSQISLPDASLASPPSATPLRGAVGMSINYVSIYGPFEAGFVDGQVCTGGTCSGGLDVPTCEKVLEAT